MSNDPSNQPALPPVPGQSRGAAGSDTFEVFLSGRGLAIAGAILILIGCAFFIDLSFTRGWIGPGERIALGLIAGSALLAASARFLWGKYRFVAEAACGLGASLTYVSSWAALSVFPDLHVPRAAAFATMAAATFVLMLIANRWRSQPVALMGLAGAYLTPVLLGGELDRAALATYLFIVTGGMLALARRRAFTNVEFTAVAATLAYGMFFVPNLDLGWTETAAATVATAFFLLFATAFTIRPIASGAAVQLALVPFIATTTLYIGALEALFNAHQTALGIMLLGLSALLIAAPTLIKHISVELKPAYRSMGILALNLALRSLLHRVELLDAFSIEAACLVIFGARASNVNVTRTGLGFSALAGIGLLAEALTTAPTQTLFTPLVLGFAVWLQAAFSARRAIPQNLQPAWSLGVHGMALAALTRAALDATGGPAWNTGLPDVTEMTLSLIWAACGAALFGRGVATRAAVMRGEGLVLFLITIAKVFSVDLAFIDIAYRSLAFCGTGIALFASSAWYMRSVRSDEFRNAA